MTHSVEVSVLVSLAPAEVFGYFTEENRYVRWMGSEATLDPVPAGEYRVRMPDGFAAAGTFAGGDPGLDPHV